MEIEINNLSFSYSQKVKPALSDISLLIPSGRLVYLIGPNGSGKSTLLRCIGGLVKPLSGYVKIQGREIFAFSKKERAQLIGFVPQQEIPVFSFKVRDVVVTGRVSRHSIFGLPSASDYQIADKALFEVGIAHLSERVCSEISGGEWQLVMIARALSQDPRILLLDEPTSHLDLANQMKVLSVIKKLVLNGYTCILVSHNPDQVFLIDGFVAAMKEGHLIYSGLAVDVIIPEIMQEIYDIPVMVAGQTNGLVRGICVPLLPDEKE
ncbi:ABC transporter ATP-binding protein [Methanospirillum lacunae]|uniref:Cobalamin import ATP-binding protein BtuD n=1 Tax=Methanospirillum lacunae TaxID=668570 RepID=A0A2V2NAF9_9EURY|nr:ABC transporter ATP-binding protein [Methanospirillum lacunae]PWR72541.1 iron ABC transporter ATP-binding protein [Methanospirillum lacunae]